MTNDELKQAARECLLKAFKSDPNVAPAPPHVVQAAVTILLSSIEMSREDR